MDVAVGLWVSHRHPSPLVIVLRFEGHNVSKIWTVVVPGLDGLTMKGDVLHFFTYASFTDTFQPCH